MGEGELGVRVGRAAEPMTETGTSALNARGGKN